jgi:hypothetical protein
MATGVGLSLEAEPESKSYKPARGGRPTRGSYPMIDARGCGRLAADPKLGASRTGTRGIPRGGWADQAQMGLLAAYLLVTSPAQSIQAREL